MGGEAPATVLRRTFSVAFSEQKHIMHFPCSEIKAWSRVETRLVGRGNRRISEPVRTARLYPEHLPLPVLRGF